MKILVVEDNERVARFVTRGLREAAYGLGATKFEVSTRVVLPAGLSGVFASFILAVSRAVGETMAVVLAAGQRPRLTLNPSQVKGVAQGRRLAARDLGELPVPGGLVALIDSEGTLIALAELDPKQGRLQPRKVLI